jgi:hypothetical protein
MAPRTQVSGHPAIAPHMDKFYGIRNGIDQDIWDPREDRFLPRCAMGRGLQKMPVLAVRLCLGSMPHHAHSDSSADLHVLVSQISRVERC